MEKIRADMAATIERAKAEDPKELRRQIAERDKRIKALESKAPATNPAALEKAREQGRVEAERWAAREVGKVKRALFTLNTGIGQIEQAAEVLREMVTGELVVKDLRDFAARPPQTFKAPSMPKPLPERQLATSGSVRKSESNGRLPIGEHKTLTAIAQFESGVSRKQLIVLTGYKRSSRDAYIQRLYNKDMVAVNGDTVTATEEGIRQLGSDFEPLPTGSALYEHWIGRLPEGERKVLEVLAAAYPDPVQREKIDETTGYMRSSRDAYLQRLRARRLVEEAGRGLVKASDLLFD
jgi:chromosome segregation and condensation protein ScpB